MGGTRTRAWSAICSDTWQADRYRRSGSGRALSSVLSGGWRGDEAAEHATGDRGGEAPGDGEEAEPDRPERGALERRALSEGER